jgi:hypothetical protein
MNKESPTNDQLADYSRQFHDALGIPFALPKYRRVIPITNGKHGLTFKVVMSHTPPSKSDVGVQRATPQNNFPTG